MTFLPPKRFAWLLTAILAGIPLPWARAEVAAQPPVRVGYIDFPPYSYTDERGQPAGHLLEFFEQVAQRAGYRTQFIEYPSYRLFKTMENGSIDMCPSLIRHPVMSQYTLRSRYLIARVLLNLYYQGQPPPTQLDELRNARVLLIQGLVYPGSPLAVVAENPANGVLTSTAPTHRAAAQMMYLQRADYLLDYQDPAESGFREAGLPVLPHVTLLQQDFTMAFSQASPRARQLRDDFDGAIEALRAAGQLPEKYRAIFPYADEAQDPPTPAQ